MKPNLTKWAILQLVHSLQGKNYQQQFFDDLELLPHKIE